MDEDVTGYESRKTGYFTNTFSVFLDAKMIQKLPNKSVEVEVKAPIHSVIYHAPN